MSSSVLVVDDEKDIAQLVKLSLTKAGYRVHVATNADAAFAYLKTEKAELILLDINLPGISGLRLLEMLRQEQATAALPVILLTVLGASSDKVKGLKQGADDYLVKPFSTEELLARVEALLRRSQYAGQPKKVLDAGGILLDLDRLEVSAKGRRVDLSPAEFQLLALFMRRKGFVLTYQILSDSLSQGEKIMTSDNIYAHVKNLRRKLGPQGDLIETVHGIGYKFVVPTR